MIGSALVKHRAGCTYILISSQGFIDVPRRELVQLLVVPKYDDCDIDGTKHRQLVRFLEQATLSLEERSASLISLRSQSHASDTYTDLLRSSLMALISIFLRPILP